MNVDVFHDLIPHLQGQLRGGRGSAVKLKLANNCNFIPPLLQHSELHMEDSNNRDTWFLARTPLLKPYFPAARSFVDVQYI